MKTPTFKVPGGPEGLPKLGLIVGRLANAVLETAPDTKVGYRDQCKICGALNPTGVCGNSRLEWHERIAALGAALEAAERILGHELEESSLDDARNYRRIEDALQVIRKVLPGKGEK